MVLSAILVGGTSAIAATAGAITSTAITAEFCERYDQASFGPDYPTEPIGVFESMVRRVFAEPRYLPPGWV